MSGSAFMATAAFIACSSDSGGTSSTPNPDGSVADSASDGQSAVDSSKADAGADSAPVACQSCSDFLENGPGAAGACETNGPPSSKQLIKAWFTDCVCNQDAGAAGCFAECADTCSAFTAPSDACQTCFSSVCGASLSACAADGADAGPITDAGGDGG
jgi:hypothetical protein